MQPRPALILFAHGARDPRWAQSLHRLADAVRRQAQVEVSVAFLEIQSPTLPQALEQAASAGIRQIRLAPVFWAGAGHIENDLPPLLAAFSTQRPDVVVEVLPVLSELPGLLDFVARALGDAPGVPLAPPPPLSGL